MSLTLEAVLALAPDAASAKAARDLAVPAKWPTLGADAGAAWGECQGSGARPYQTQVDLSGPAFKCSCPSRKFPCKHGLALLMLRAQHPDRFSTTTQPAWVTEWLATRETRAQKKQERQAAADVTPVDPEAVAARDAQRWARIEGAALDLQRWLSDQMTRGLGALGDDARASWQAVASRMVDQQAPGLGQRVLIAAAGLRHGADWPERTLQRLGLLHLVCEAVGRRRELPDAVQADLRVAVGWPHDKADVLAQGERLGDRWTVVGVALEERDDKLTERRVWLHGERSGRRAWLLEHAFGGRGFDLSWLPGTSVDVELAFFPGGSGLRAVLAGTAPPPGPPRWPSSSHDQEWRGVSARVAACPWVSLHPVVLREAVPVRHGDGLVVVAGSRAVPLSLASSDGWGLLAVSGGHAVHVMGEWDGHALAPLSLWRDDSLTPLWLRSTS